MPNNIQRHLKHAYNLNVRYIRYGYRIIKGYLSLDDYVTNKNGDVLIDDYLLIHIFDTSQQSPSNYQRDDNTYHLLPDGSKMKMENEK